MLSHSRLTYLLLVFCTPCVIHADTTIVDDDFESYADSAALYQVWSGSTNGKIVDETFTEFITFDDLDPQDVGARAFPEDGQGVEHIGGTVLEYQPLLNSGPIVPTESQSIVLQGDIFDTGNTGNKRNTIGLRSTSPNNIVELGHYNEDIIELSTRAILFENPIGPSWQFYELPVELDRETDEDEITTLGDLGEAWHTHKVTITPTTLTFEIDLFRDGLDASTGQAGFDASITVDVEPFSTGFQSLRIGGPSNVSSAGNGLYGGVIFDNISLKLVDVTEGLLGDYNNDQVVNAADYTLWRDTLGDSVAEGSGADGNSNGVIDAGDYQVWRDNYGNIPSLSGAVAAPEPSAILSLIIGCGLAAASRRRPC